MTRIRADNNGIPQPTQVLETHVGMAHFANTGPLGATCGDCGYYRRGRCQKYRELMKIGGKSFPKETAACTHFSSDKIKLHKREPVATSALFTDLPEQRR